MSLLALCLVHLANAQLSSTVGKEFYFTFMPNGGLSGTKMTVHLTAEVTTSGTIQVIGSDFFQEFTVNGGSSLEISIPDDFKLGTSGSIEKKAIYVSTVEDVTAYAYSQKLGFSDGTILLPLEALDKEYLVHVKGENTQFAVLATDNETDIEITFARDSIEVAGVFYMKDEKIQYRLDRGDIFLLQSNKDLSATEIKVVDNGTVDCKKIAVFVANGPYQSTDHRYNQLYAVRDWGKEYFALLFGEPHDNGIVYFMGSEDSTWLEVSGVPGRYISRGETFIIHAEIEHYVKADKPISVLHTGAGVMNLLSPLKQTSKNILFEIIGTPTVSEHFLSVFTPSDRLNVLLDDTDISDQFKPVQLGNDYSFALLEIEPGVHRLRASEGAVAFTYGFGDKEAAAYAIGGNLGNFEIALENLDSNLPAGKACMGNELLLSAEAEDEILTELYTEFRWDMGDGTIIDGAEISHAYAAPGDYVITLFASKSPIACSDLSVSRNIEVIDAAIDAIVGPESICPNVGPIDYVLDGSESDYIYEWFSVGGELISSDGPNASVDWDFAAPTHQLKAVSVSPLGCVSDTVYLDVSYKTVLEPILPLGPAAVCGDFTGVAYAVPRSEGSVYHWIVEGGEVVTGQGTHEIMVDWDGPGNYRLWYEEESTTQTDVCKGTSDVLPIVVSEAMDISIETTAVTCPGDNSGSATVTVSGGAAPYTIAWATGSGQNTISGLAGGEYDVVITDAAGCSVTRTAIVYEPEPLTGFVLSTDAECSNDTGTARVVVTGGTGPYTYQWTEASVFVRNPERNGLGEGSYEVTVKDENGCQIVLGYNIAVPQPITYELAQTQPCPGTSEGALLLSVDGGTGPYHYAWEAAAWTNDQQLDNIPSGSYKVLVTDAEGCKLNVNAELTDLAPMIRMPDAFSPNGDDDNDLFLAVYNCRVSFSMYVYSQWGGMVFVSHDIGRGWDGTYEGQPVPAGDYAYHIVYNSGSVQESVKGRVRLFR